MVPRRPALAAAALCTLSLTVVAVALDSALSSAPGGPLRQSPSGVTGPPLGDWLFDLLWEWLGLPVGGGLAGGSGGQRLLVAAVVLGGLALLAGGCVAVWVVVRRSGTTDTSTVERVPESARERPQWPPEPRTAVGQAWLTLVRTLDADRPHTRTTREWERRAVAAGYDPKSVGRLRASVDRTRYAGVDPESQADVAHKTLASLGLDDATNRRVGRTDEETMTTTDERDTGVR